MNVVFFSSCTNHFSSAEMTHTVFPASKSEWKKLEETFPEHKFFAVTQQPSLFLLEGEESFSESIKISSAETPEDFANDILSFFPDLVIAASFWLTPFDWLSLEDSLIAEIVQSRGIKTIAHKTKTSLLCFDKSKCCAFLEQNGFTIPPTLYVHHDLFFAERRRKDVKTNAYKDYVFGELSRMKFPVVIKDTSGVSSYRMEVCRTLGEARAFLLSGKNQADKIVQTYISGVQYGVEIYGAEGNYAVMPPFVFSVNKYGITSPRQGVKAGPFKDVPMLAALEKEMTRLSFLLSFSGIAQVDLVFAENKWYVIEINPRLSGMTSGYAASLGMSVLELLTRIAFGEKISAQKMHPVCNMKIPLTSRENLSLLASQKNICSVRQTENHLAKQERERGYGEIVFRAEGESFSSLWETLTSIKEKFSPLLERDFVILAEKLIRPVRKLQFQNRLL